MSAVSTAPDAGALALLEKLSIGMAAAALLGMVVVEGWQVVARYVLNDSPGWTEPMALLCLGTAMMFGAAAGVRRERHFAFSLLVGILAAPLQRAIRAACHALVAALGAFLGWHGGVLMIDGIDVAMAGTALPQGAMFAPLCFGGALIAVFALERLVVELRREPAPETAERG